MWARIKAIFRSLFGWMLRGAENPELILRQHIDDLRQRVPQMRRDVAEVIKLEKMLQIQADRLEKKVAYLEPKVIQAVKLGPEKKDAAKALISALEQARQDLEETQAQLEQASQNSERMKRTFSAYERRVQDQIQECMNQISRAKRAKSKGKVALFRYTLSAAHNIVDICDDHAAGDYGWGEPGVGEVGDLPVPGRDTHPYCECRIVFYKEVGK